MIPFGGFSITFYYITSAQKMQELINKSADAVLRRRSMRQPWKRNTEKSQKGIDKSEKL
jgi:hypothetical protein